jgi:hypothetical protein
VEKLMQAFGLTKEAASLVKYNLRTLPPSDAMDMADIMLDGHGVEAIRGDDREGTPYGSFWQDTVALYVNRGGTYDTTLVYDVGMDRIEVGSWGGWVEWTQEKGRVRSYRRKPASRRCACRRT